MESDRILAIDWSGNKRLSSQRKHIWMADWNRGAVTLTNKRTGTETVNAVVAAGRDTPATVAGFDFSFSYPAWFLAQRGLTSAPALWKQAQEQGDAWLQSCEPPFWGRPARTCPLDHWEPLCRGFRSTECEVRKSSGKWPSSSFKIGGAGAVGTGSLRGMPHLLTLQKSGFSIWPFDPPRLPMAIEIYPRIFTKGTVVTDQGARAKHLEGTAFRLLSDDVLAAAQHSPDAFDALCAMIGMVESRKQLATLPARPHRALEGEIWMPLQM